jgi:hypothetical protein
MVAMVVLVFVVAGRMFATRVGEMKAKHIHPQQVASAKAMAEKVEDSRAADHFRNLFEMPVLFYAACLAAVQTGVDAFGPLLMAWGFVAARALMAFEACGRNKVMRRFHAFIASSAALLALWVMLALHWAGVL